MGQLYFTRHGQTIWNVENKICGATDIELTNLGHQQAVTLGKEIAKQELKIDEILYSPLIRLCRNRQTHFRSDRYSNANGTTTERTKFWTV